MQRREWIGAAMATSIFVFKEGNLNAAADARRAGFTMDLCPGKIGVKVDQRQAIDLARKYGFQSVEPFGSYLSSLASGELESLLSLLKDSELVWGAAGLDVNFRGTDSEFDKGIQALPSVAAGMQRANVTRVGTWLSSSHHELTYLQNFKQHSQRLRKIANILRDHGIRFGLEYVGPKTSWTSKKHSFIHTLAETMELIAAVDASNIGVILDSWHWYCAAESVPDLLTLTNAQIVAVDLNDAPSGIERESQIDNRRELPAATGVIDLRGFMGALKKIGYDGPIRAEPFNQKLNALEDDEAVMATATAMRKGLES